MKTVKKRVAAIGTFDGVHLGHKSVLGVMADYASRNNMDGVAITFHRHPLSLIDPNREPSLLTHSEEKGKLLQDCGADVIFLDFTEELRSTTVDSWMKSLRDEYGVGALVVGYDNTFGCDGLNLSLEDYKKIGGTHGIEVLTAPEIKGVSSSAIRKAVESGDVKRAGEMLGRNYSLSGRVVRGNSVGRSLGFPTANLLPVPGRAVPAPGVYAAKARIDERQTSYPAMVNIGKHPTILPCEDNLIEAHILDFDEDLYDKTLHLDFLERLRDEEKFESIEDLKRQLESDRELVRKLTSGKVKQK